uniref:Uncharacterized protein n=1 Tax=Cucumis melo TaxID=3656 RepID=A0A9I9D1Z6_CUCME
MKQQEYAEQKSAEIEVKKQDTLRRWTADFDPVMILNSEFDFWKTPSLRA